MSRAKEREPPGCSGKALSCRISDCEMQRFSVLRPPRKHFTEWSSIEKRQCSMMHSPQCPHISRTCVQADIAPQQPSLIAFQLFCRHIRKKPVAPTNELGKGTGSSKIITSNFKASFLFCPLHFTIHEVPSRNLQSQPAHLPDSQNQKYYPHSYFFRNRILT